MSHHYSRIHFEIVANIEQPCHIRITGSSPMLGSFNTGQMVRMVTTKETFPLWKTDHPIIAPLDTGIRYKYAVCEGNKILRWEKLNGSRSCMPTNSDTFITDELDVKSSTCCSHVNSMADFNVHHSEEDLSPLIASNKIFVVAYHLPVRFSANLEADGSYSWIADWDEDNMIAKSEGSLSDQNHVIWVGCVTSRAFSGVDPSIPWTKEIILSALEELHNVIPIFIDPTIADMFYQGYCKTVLWPMWHNVLPKENLLLKNHLECWNAYEQVNALIAEQLLTECQTDDVLWVHDYHLCLLPAQFTKRWNATHPTSHPTLPPVKVPKMVFYMHVPFPNTTVFRCNGQRIELLEGMLAASSIGFHAFEYARHFLNACKRILGCTQSSRGGSGMLFVEYQERAVAVTTSHAGVETRALNDAISLPCVKEQALSILNRHPGKCILGSVDESQRLKGTVLKLLAIENLLHEYECFRGRICLVQKCIKLNSRPKIDNRSTQEIILLRDRINERFGEDTIDIEFAERYPREKRVALWLATSVFFNTAVFEGLNLYPLEYVYTCHAADESKSIDLQEIADRKIDFPCDEPGFLCLSRKSRKRQNSHLGMVIMSEFSIAARVLNGAVRVNPWSVREVVNQLDFALKCDPAERLRRRQRDFDYISSRPANTWAKQTILDMIEADTLSHQNTFTDIDTCPVQADTMTGIGQTQSSLAPLVHRSETTGRQVECKLLDNSVIAKAFRSAKRRLIICDYGGTLVERESHDTFVKKEFAGVCRRAPNSTTLKHLRRLANESNTHVAVVSGISSQQLEKNLGKIKNITLVAQGGAKVSCSQKLKKAFNDEEMKCEICAHRNASNGQADIHNGIPHIHSVKRRTHHAEREWIENVPPEWETAKNMAYDIMERYRWRTNGSHVRKYEGGVVFNFRLADPEYGVIMSRQLIVELREKMTGLPVQVISKKQSVEVINSGINKATFLPHLLQTISGADFILCVGDDAADEVMFSCLLREHANSLARKDEKKSSDILPIKSLVTCTVDKKMTQASHYAIGVSGVLCMLRACSDVVEEEL